MSSENKKKLIRIIPILLLIIIIILTVVFRKDGMENIYSGTVEAREVNIGPKISGRIEAILAEEGDRVEKGQGVVVVAAMKMETTLNAPHSGVVSKVNVAENDKVMPGDILVDIDEIKAEKPSEFEN